jgi:hypothetical protein
MRPNALKIAAGLGVMLLAAALPLGVLRGIALAGAPPGHFVVDGGMGTVTDQKTGLVWQRFAVPPRRNLAGAQTYCQTLDLGGISAGAWRLPSIKELATIYDANAATPPLWDWDVFGESGPGQLWSTTPDVTGSNGEVWILDVVSGDIQNAAPSTTEGVLCVH